ncbi:TSUP family transporter [Xanthobacter autotrophicus DSM 431]|uniref:TSUP family transporter n=1 Tax=Xanthobacter nonsaccharivorans TaxID=3119912 RepID=UPI003729BADE
MSDGAVVAAIGVMSVIAAGRHLLSRRRHRPQTEAGSYAAALWGLGASLTSMIANAGGPPMMIYLLRRGPHLTPQQFAATAFFAVVNWVKVPFFLALGYITGANLATSGALLPVAILTTAVGVRLVAHVSSDRFRCAIYLILDLVGLKLVYDGLAPWL